MSTGKENRGARGRALRLIAFPAVIIAAVLLLMVFAAGLGNTPPGSPGDSQGSAAVIPSPGGDPAGTGAIKLGAPETGQETATGAKLPDGQTAQIRFDDDTGVPSFVSGPLTAPAAPSPQQSAVAFLNVNKDLFHMSNPGSELTLERQNVDSLGMTHLHMAQVYQGVPVFASDMAVHFTPDGKIAAINGRYVPGVSLSTAPDLTVDQAVAAAQSDFGGKATPSSIEPTQLMILAQDRQAMLAWKVTLVNDNPPARMVYFVDAHTGAIDAKYSALEGARNRMTYTAGNGTSLPGTLLISEGGSSTDTVAQATHNNTGATYDYYWTTFGRDSFNNAGATLTSSVHFGSGYNNAYWNGYQMVYGDGDGYVFSPLGMGLDVVAHELTHAVTQYSANLVYSYQSGALNESYSDVFGEMVENYAHGSNDWLMGEDVYTPTIPGDALRSLSNPPQYGQPDNMSKYVATTSDNGGVHTNSGIPNKAAYNIASAIGTAKMQQIYYRTLTLYLTSSAQFTDARDASVQAATDLYGASSPEVAAVQNGFAAVGIGGTTPSATTARIEINHTYRGDLVVTLGVGDPNSPTWSTIVSNRQGGSADNIYTTVDIAAGAANLPPSWQNRWFLKVYDAAAQDTGSIQKFSITDNGTTYTAADVPIPINDYQTSISYIPTADNTPPTVASTNPANGANGVFDSAGIAARFSEPIASGTLTTSSFTLTNHADGSPVSGQVSWDGSSNAAAFNPSAELAPMTQYDATLTTAITDTAGNPLTQNYTWSFTTGPPARDYFFTWYDMASYEMSDWLVMGNPVSSNSASAFDVYIGDRKSNGTPLSVQPGHVQPVTYAGSIGGPVEVESLGGNPQVVSRRTLYGDSFEEIAAVDQYSLDSHYYFTWYDARTPGSRNWVMIANPGATAVAADIYIAGQKMNAAPYSIAPGTSVTPEFPGVMGGPVEVVAYDPGNPAQPRNVIASQRVLWDGNFNEVSGIPASRLTSDYIFTWYDMKSPGASDWVLISNPSASRDMYAEIWIGGQKMTNTATGDQYFPVPAGGTITPTFRGLMAGPVEVKGYDSASYVPSNPGAPNMNFFTTQRSLFGNSFEEVSGYGLNRLAATYHFSWYDQQSPGSTDWVLVSNPGATPVKAEVWIGGTRMTTLSIPPGASQVPTFNSVMNGPVEVRGYNAATYDPNNPGTPNAEVFSSQRVLWNGHFNEVEGVVLP